ncbi:MAG: substrate-binding domain-containing protein [Candidatus Dojkabacteria bacterium]
MSNNPDTSTVTPVMSSSESSSISPSENNSQKKSLLKISLLILLAIVISVFATYSYLSNSGSVNKVQTSTAKKMCEGVNITFFPGGNVEDSFASVVYKGAKQAESDLGANVTYAFSGWDPDKMVSQFIDAIGSKPDGIAIMGHPGTDALRPFVDEAERKNIKVTMQNVDLPEIREKYISEGFGYVGQSLYDSGLSVGNAVIRKYQPTADTEAIVFGVDPITNPTRYERTKGAIDALKKGNLMVHELTMSTEVQDNANSPAGEKLFTDALAQFPNVKYIITDHGALTSAAPIFLNKLGKAAGDIIVAGFDMSDATIAGIKNGYIGLVLDQQPYLQGYLPILQLCLTKKYSFAGLYIDTGVGLIDSSNVDLVSELVKQKIR